jgi:hypothetical protein
MSVQSVSMTRETRDVIVFRNLAPVADLSTLPPEVRDAIQRFRERMHVGEEIDLSGEWWGVITFEDSCFVRCESQPEAERAGLQLGRERGVAVWLEANGHSSARLLASFR